MFHSTLTLAQFRYFVKWAGRSVPVLSKVQYLIPTNLGHTRSLFGYQGAVENGQGGTLFGEQVGHFSVDIHSPLSPVG